MKQKIKSALVRFLDDFCWETPESLVWWRGDLTAKERIIRAAKQFDAWLMDLLYPEIEHDDDDFPLGL